MKQLKPDHYNLSFEVPELGTRSISFSTPPGSTPDSIKLAMRARLRLQ